MASNTSHTGGAHRAKQFAPFAALKGYYELIEKAEKTIEPRRELTDEEALELSHIVSQLKRGDMARVTYYEADGYLTREGAVSNVDIAIRRLWLIRTEIRFDDIYRIELL